MDTVGKDIKHAWRLFRENKLFTATAVAALTLGIGVNIAIFSVVNAVLLKPIPYSDPDSLVQMLNTNNGAQVALTPRQRSTCIGVRWTTCSRTSRRFVTSR